MESLTDEELAARFETLMREQALWQSDLDKYERLLFQLYYEELLPLEELARRVEPKAPYLVISMFKNARAKLDKKIFIMKCRKEGTVLPLDFWLTKKSVNELRNKGITDFRQFTEMTKDDAYRLTRYGHVSSEFGTIVGAMKQMGLSFLKREQ